MRAILLKIYRRFKKISRTAMTSAFNSPAVVMKHGL
jgi:hypothetical protein